MNIINKVFLRLALLPSPVYKKMGINITQLRAILVTKLTMDDRRPSTLYHSQRKKDKPVSAATLITMVISAVMGMLFLLAFSFGTNYSTSFTIYFALLFVMLSASLISDFTSVLIDIRDNFIILPKPVTDRTFVTGRMLHIFIHLCKIIVPMGLPGFIYIFSETGIGGAAIFSLMLIMVAMFSIFFINALYILILKITTPARFQSVISYIQIIFAIIIYASYQIVPRMMDRMGMSGLDVNQVKWMIAFPFYWFASAWSVLYEMNGTSLQFVAAALGLLLPATSLFLVVKYLAPSFNNKLAMINISGQGNEGNKRSSAQPQFSYPRFLSRIVTGSPAEKMGFLITWKLTSRSRDFKLKVYPGIGYLFVYAVIIFWNTASESLESIREENLKGRAMMISVLYFTSLILIMALNQMIYSEKHKASWVYYITPLSNPGSILLGAAKSVMMKFFIPLVLLITTLGMVLLGIKVLPHIILGMFNVLLIASLLVLVGNKAFPFSMHQNNNSNTGGFMRNMFILLVSGMIGGVHFLLYNITAVIWIFAVLSIIATWLIMSGIKNTSWHSIKSRYVEE
jgi:hypothetical protein